MKFNIGEQIAYHRKLNAMTQEDLSQRLNISTQAVSKWGEFDPDRWAAFYNWLNEKNLLEAKIDPDFGFTNKYLPE